MIPAVLLPAGIASARDGATGVDDSAATYGRRSSNREVPGSGSQYKLLPWPDTIRDRHRLSAAGVLRNLAEESLFARADDQP